MATPQRLQQLLEAFEASLRSDQPNTADVAAALTEVLELLALPGGNTDDHCKAVDLFICLRVVTDARLGGRLTSLPPELIRIIEDASMCLHDTQASPDVARAFDSTPEQLLARIRSFWDAKRDRSRT